MYASQIVARDVQRDGRKVRLQLLRKPVAEAREPLGRSATKGAGYGWRTWIDDRAIGEGRQFPTDTGQIGVKEIERLIQKLELDKEILADQTDIIKP